jgi:hypothetical protein
MIRGHKKVTWDKMLAPEDVPYLSQKIDPDEWYPMATFERMGNAILREVADGHVEAVRMWGRISVDALSAKHPSLVAQGDPVDTLRRFHVMRKTFFDFDAIEVKALTEEEATIAIRYHMGKPAEEAACFQTMGFFERLLEVGGASTVSGTFTRTSWTQQGDTPEGDTLLTLHWQMT